MINTILIILSLPYAAFIVKLVSMAVSERKSSALYKARIDYLKAVENWD